ncbi:hypothetical protein B5566_02640 [Mycobacterium sp. MHSD3]|nr:hypothetical protein B5566_02640 [Mycobacterium sp. MHSD3]
MKKRESDFGTDLTKWLITKSDNGWCVCSPIYDRYGRNVPNWPTVGGTFPTGAEAFKAFAAGRKPA